MPKINFHKRYRHFFFRESQKIKEWIAECIKFEGKKLKSIDFFFCSDREVLRENISSLQHDTLTDVITYDLSDLSDEVSGEIIISIERVRENSVLHGTSFVEELHLVMIHGVIHLMDYNDITTEEKKIMREKEQFFLSLR